LGKYEDDRREMIDLLRERGIQDTRVLNAMAKVERHLFVKEAFINRAYDDCALPIGHSQTISQPYTVAFMTEALRVTEGDKVLEIGTGSGYQAAILAEMGTRVFTIERHYQLLDEARKRLERLGYHVAAKMGDGTLGWSEFEPYNGILVTAGAPEVPQPLLDQLADNGRLVIPVGGLDEQKLHIIQRNGDTYTKRVVYGFKFVPLIGKKGWSKT
jgi:protein-L-isoaspartate(D-aspartate) O-methyltransferase